MEEQITQEQANWGKESISAIVDNIEKVIIGKRSVVELVVLSMISGGHVLLEDVPGVGKTSIVSSIAKTVSCSFKRIQFTPDTMPSDVTGFSIYNQKTGDFEFRKGSIMSNIVLADEINRASAKTQASLLEAMEEKQVTVDSNTYTLKEPFMVMATQNPIDSFGTYPLPEAQIDRFLIKISIGYPTLDEEVQIVLAGKKAKDELKPVISEDDILKLKALKEQVYVSSDVARYIVQIVTSTRTHSDVVLGSSPRGSLALYSLCRAYAMYKGRTYVSPDDVKYLASHTLSHRLILTHEAKTAKRTPEQIIESILQSVIVPVGQGK